MKLSFRMILIAEILVIFSSIASPVRILRQSSSPAIANEVAKVKATHNPRRLKRSSSDDMEIKCNNESLHYILDKCETAAEASVGTQNSQRRRKRSGIEQPFCGAGCSHMVINYVNICGLQEYIVNVSGACKLSGGEFKVNCIHAAVVVKPGIISCMNPHQQSVSHEVRHIVNFTKNYRQSKCCSLQSYANPSLPGHDIIFDRQTNIFRVDPPLLPPWKAMDISKYPPILDLTSSNLCVEEERTVSKAHDLGTTPKSLNPSSQLRNSAGSNTNWHSNTWMFYFCASLMLSSFGLVAQLSLVGLA